MKKKEEPKLPERPPITGYYIEVVYFVHKEFSGRKSVDYSLEVAQQMFSRTVNKLTESGQEAIVSIFDSNHDLVKSERLNF